MLKPGQLVRLVLTDVPLGHPDRDLPNPLIGVILDAPVKSCMGLIDDSKTKAFKVFWANDLPPEWDHCCTGKDYMHERALQAIELIGGQIVEVPNRSR